MSEKLEQLKNTVPEKKRTLMENHLEIKNATSAQRNVNIQDHPSSPGNKVVNSNAQLAVGIATSRGRSASPKKASNSTTARGPHQTPCCNSPKKGKPKKTPTSCLEPSEISRKHENKHLEISENAVIGKTPVREKQGRSASPQKYPKSERNKNNLSLEQGLTEFQDKAPAGFKNSRTVQLKGEKVTSEGTKEDKKQNVSVKDEKFPSETAHTKTEERSLLGPTADQLRKEKLEDGKMKKSYFEEFSSSQFKMAGLPDEPLLSGDKSTRLEAEELVVPEPADKTKEDGIFTSESRSPVKKIITPGPWKVPSASRVTKATGVTDKRV